MRDEQTMSLICFSGVNTAEGSTHVQICLGTEGGADPGVAPYFMTITIANNDSSSMAGSGPGGEGGALRQQIPLTRRDMDKLKRWLAQVLPDAG